MDLTPKLTCSVCGINPALGVASSGFMPMSFAYCETCLRKPAEAPLVFHYLYTEVFAGDVENTSLPMKGIYTFRDGEYISWPDWVEKVGKKIDLEEYWKEQDDWFSNAAEENEMSKFCVIGNSGPVSMAKRTWFDDADGATTHATAIANESYAIHGKPLSLFVVEVVRVVEIGIPDVKVRELAEADFAPVMMPQPQEETPQRRR